MCVEMEFRRTFQASTKCNNWNNLAFYASRNVCVKGIGLKCLRKIHLNKQLRGGGGGGKGRLRQPCSDSGRDNALADEDGLWWGEDSTNPRGIHLENVQSTKLCRQFRLVSPSSAGRPAALVATPLEQQQSIYGDQNDPQPTNLTRFFPSKKIMGLLRR